MSVYKAVETIGTEHQVLACITEVKSSWRLLKEAVEQARARQSLLRIIVCHRYLRARSNDEFAHFFGKFRHAALQICKENNLRLIIETLDCGNRESVEIERIIKEIDTDVLLMSDYSDSERLTKWLPTQTNKLKQTTSCSVMLIR